MTQPTRDLFDAFTRLPEAEQLAFAMEVLRWTTDREATSLDDDEPDDADDLLLNLDSEETVDPLLVRGEGRLVRRPIEEPPL